MKMFFKMCILGSAICALAACSSTHFGRSGSAGAEDTGATTSGLEGQAQFADNDGFVVNTLKAPYDQVYYFEFDRDMVRASDNQSLSIQANYLVAHPNARVRLDGNTDERGSREYNVALGWRRAKAVRSMLRQAGVPASQIITNSYGEEKPVAFCHDESCYKLNRRVNLTYEAK